MAHSSFIIPALLFSLLSMAVSDLYKELPATEPPKNHPGVVKRFFDRDAAGDACVTREGAKGVCMPIQECQSALRELRARRRPTHCGFEGHTPIVCCPEDPLGTPTPLPKPAAFISVDSAGKDEGSDGSLRKAGADTGATDGEGSEVGTRRKPGEAATYWCAQYRAECNKRQGPYRRFERGVERNSIPDYEDFGTTERPPARDHPWIEIFDDSIVGGQNIIQDEYPHMAAVGFGKQSDIRWECGGSLISNSFVLTAAHCLIARDGSRAEWVLLGANYVSDQLRGYSVSSDGVIHHVVRRIRHPEYKTNSKYNDVALLELGPSLQYNKYSSHGVISPACLQVEWDSQMKTAMATGWGRLGHGEKPSSSLQKVKLNLLDNSICNETYDVEIRLSKLSNGIDDSMICAGDLQGGKDTCQGDSGGPLQHKTDDCLIHIIGVTSFGKICGFADTPAVYMRVTHFIPWIEGIVWPEENIPKQ